MNEFPVSFDGAIARLSNQSIYEEFVPTTESAVVTAWQAINQLFSHDSTYSDVTHYLKDNKQESLANAKVSAQQPWY